MKTKLSFTTLLIFFGVTLIANIKGTDFSSKKDSTVPNYSKLSLYAGYGKHGSNFRLDLQLSDKHFNHSSTLFYIELGGQGITFDQPNLNFAGIEYPSDCRLVTLGGGIAQEFLFNNRWSVMPFIGLRNEYVSFKSSALADAIGNSGLQRYADNAMTIPVGPAVNNAYGDASSFDIGCRLGIRLGKRFYLMSTIGYSPIHFDTGDTMFGQYWGQAPYFNPYWVKRNPSRYELALRMTLNH
jgi:hypothetical protein